MKRRGFLTKLGALAGGLFAGGAVAKKGDLAEYVPPVPVEPDALMKFCSDPQWGRKMVENAWLAKGPQVFIGPDGQTRTLRPAQTDSVRFITTPHIPKAEQTWLERNYGRPFLRDWYAERDRDYSYEDFVRMLSPDPRDHGGPAIVDPKKLEPLADDWHLTANKVWRIESTPETDIVIGYERAKRDGWKLSWNPARQEIVVEPPVYFRGCSRLLSDDAFLKLFCDSKLRYTATCASFPQAVSNQIVFERHTNLDSSVYNHVAAEIVTEKRIRKASKWAETVTEHSIPVIMNLEQPTYLKIIYPDAEKRIAVAAGISMERISMVAGEEFKVGLRRIRSPLVLPTQPIKPGAGLVRLKL